MKVVFAVLLGAAALLTAGCGSSSNNAAETTVTVDTTTEQTDTSSTETSSSADTSTESADTSTESTSTTGTISDNAVNAAGLSAGCKKVANLSIQFSTAIAQASTTGGGQDLTATAKAFENFANQVPEEIRNDFKVIAAAFAKYIQVIKDLDLTPGNTPSTDDIAKLTQASQALTDANVKAANAAVTKWASDNCSGTNP